MKISAALAIVLTGLGVILCARACFFSQQNQQSQKSAGTLDTGNGGMVERDYSPEEEHESNGPEGSVGSPMERLPIVYLGAAVIIVVCFWWLSAREPKASKS